MPDVASKYITEDWWINHLFHEKKPNLIKNINYSHEEKKILSALSQVQFSSLLHSLDEIDNYTIRDTLVNEIIYLANEVSFNISDNGISSLKLISQLIQNSNILKNWKLRRTLGKISGEIIQPMANDTSMKNYIHEFSEICFSQPQSVILIALAATQSYVTAESVGINNIKQLLTYPHPQVRWQLAKSWKNIEDIIVEKIPLDIDMFVNDKWLRRRLLITHLNETFKIHNRKKN